MDQFCQFFLSLQTAVLPDYSYFHAVPIGFGARNKEREYAFE